MRKHSFLLILFIALCNFNCQLYGTLNFANRSSAIVLGDNNTQFRVASNNSITGWDQHSLLRTSGNDNSWISSNTIYGYGIGQTNPTNYLVYSNSNAIVSLSLQTRTNSNAFAYEIKNNSNAIVGLTPLVISNSNAIVGLTPLVINNSNAIVKLARGGGGGGTIYETQQIYSSDTTVNSYVWYKAGFEVDQGVTLSLATPIFVSGQILLGGTLSLGSDIFLDSGAYLDTDAYEDVYSGYLSGNEKTLHLNGNLIIPAGYTLNIKSNTTIEGDGNTLIFEDGAQIFIEAATTLTLRNVRVQTGISGSSSPSIALNSINSRLALDNVQLKLAEDFNFNTGQLFTYNDVDVKGTNAFVYQSIMPSHITSEATLKFEPGTTLFYFNPGSAENDLIVMDDMTSKLWLNGCTLASTTTGMQLTNGTLVVEGENFISNNATSLSEATCFGDGNLNDDLIINILPGASLNVINGILNYQNVDEFP